MNLIITLLLFLTTISGFADKEKLGKLSVGCEIGVYEQDLLEKFKSSGIEVESHIGQLGKRNSTLVTRGFFIVKLGVHLRVVTSDEGVVTKISWSKDNGEVNDFKGQPWTESQNVEFNEESFRDVSPKKPEKAK